MLGIISVHIPSRVVRVEGRYRTEDQRDRAYRRFQGENSSSDLAYLFGNLLQATNPGICTEEGTSRFLEKLQYCGGWVIRPTEGDTRILDTIQVFVAGNLEVFSRGVRETLGNTVFLDDMETPLPFRDSPNREGGNLPDGKYMASQKREADKLAVLSVRDSLTHHDAINRAREVLRERPYLQTEIAIAIGGWRPRTFGG
jgi:hypothetical protein